MTANSPQNSEEEETTLTLTARQQLTQLSSFPAMTEDSSNEAESDGDNEGATVTTMMPTKEEGDKELTKYRRASIATRRASGISRVLALSSTSSFFAEALIRPTLINAMVFFARADPDVNRLRTVLAERLLCIPRFRSVVRMDDSSRVYYDPIPRSDVDLEKHIRVIDGGHTFDEDDIEDLINKEFLSHWPPDRPLWRMTLVTSLADGRSVLFIVIDHAISDGVGLVSVFSSILDHPSLEESINGCDQKNQSVLQRARMAPPTLRWSHCATAFLGGVYSSIVEIVAKPSDTMNSLKIPKDQLLVPCPGKSFAQTRGFPLSEIKAMKSKLSGTTVNDIVLALIALAIRKNMEESDGALEAFRRGGGRFKADLPINMRRHSDSAASIDLSDSGGLGNKFSVVSFLFPVFHSGPIDCVWQCKSRVDELKASPAFILSKILIDFIYGSYSDTVISAKLLGAINQSTCTIGNLIGPSEDTTLGGYAIDDLNFTTSFVGGLYFGVLSFDGNLRISALLDKRTLGHVGKLRDCLEIAYDELREALRDIDADKPLHMPDMTPLSARMFEFFIYAAILIIPIWALMQSEDPE